MVSGPYFCHQKSQWKKSYEIEVFHIVILTENHSVEGNRSWRKLEIIKLWIQQICFWRRHQICVNEKWENASFAFWKEKHHPILLWLCYPWWTWKNASFSVFVRIKPDRLSKSKLLQKAIIWWSSSDFFSYITSHLSIRIYCHFNWNPCAFYPSNSIITWECTFRVILFLFCS